MEIAPVTEALEREQSENDRHGNVFTVEEVFLHSTKNRPENGRERSGSSGLNEMQSAACSGFRMGVT